MVNFVYFGLFFETYKSSPHFFATFSEYINIGKNGLGYILGVFSQTHLLTLLPRPISNSELQIANFVGLIL
jgi:hypothetical protein